MKKLKSAVQQLKEYREAAKKAREDYEARQQAYYQAAQQVAAANVVADNVKMAKQIIMATAMDNFMDRDWKSHKQVILQDLDGNPIEVHSDGTLIVDEPENDTQKEHREKFEKSHSFKVGDEVMVYPKPKTLLDELNAIDIKTHPVEAHNKLLEAFQIPYQDKVGVVVRTATDARSGPSISVNFDGMVIKFQNPNRDLFLATDIAKLLYKDNE